MNLHINEIDIENDEVIVTDTTHHRRVVFDIEGSLNYHSDILQLACIETDWDFNIISVYNSYFRNRYPIAPEAFNVHRLSEEFLWSNANNFFPTEISKFPFYNNSPTMFITYSGFDINKINQTVKMYDLVPVEFGRSVESLSYTPRASNCNLDAMIFKGGRLKSNIDDIVSSEINNINQEISKFTDTSNLSAHNALYDSIVLLAVCRRWNKS